MRIPFNYPYITGKEAAYMQEVLASRELSGNGPFSAKCEQRLEHYTACSKAFLTTSCTSALEMAAILIDTQPGDEIIMPSYTFVSTANAFAMHGAIPVFVDIRPDTLNIDEIRIESAITPKTKAIVVMHYGGVACEMGAILALARKYNLYVIEDNAHGLLATYKDKPLGSFGHLATLSFHETKNINCGQGGALLVNDPSFIDRTYVLRDKGTNRQAFEQGLTTHYTWVDKGSNYRLSEIHAAFLWAQLEAADAITQMRLEAWRRYHKAFSNLQSAPFRLPVSPDHCQHNGHIFPLLLSEPRLRTDLISHLARKDIHAPFHYVPLHTSPAYKALCPHSNSKLPTTEQISNTLLRLPLWAGISQAQTEVIEAILEWNAN